MFGLFIVILPWIIILLLWRQMYKKASAGYVQRFSYITQYPINLCLEYMKHDNVYDFYEYDWEEINGIYYITLNKIRNSPTSGWGGPRPEFEVKFNSVVNGTKIEIIYLPNCIAPIPLGVSVKDMNLFWKTKLDAEESE